MVRQLPYLVIAAAALQLNASHAEAGLFNWFGSHGSCGSDGGSYGSDGGSYGSHGGGSYGGGSYGGSYCDSCCPPSGASYGGSSYGGGSYGGGASYGGGSYGSYYGAGANGSYGAGAYGGGYGGTYGGPYGVYGGSYTWPNGLYNDKQAWAQRNLYAVPKGRQYAAPNPHPLFATAPRRAPAAAPAETSSLPAGTATEKATVLINVPDAQTEVYFQGRRIAINGTSAQCVTPPLAVGRLYHYEIRVVHRDRETTGVAEIRPGGTFELNAVVDAEAIAVHFGEAETQRVAVSIPRLP